MFSLSSTCAERLNNVLETRSSISKPEVGFILSGSVQNVTENNGEEFPHCFREREIGGEHIPSGFLWICLNMLLYQSLGLFTLWRKGWEREKCIV